MIWDRLVELFNQIDLHGWLLLFMIAFVCFLMYQAQKNEENEFDIEHLIVDPSTNKIVLEKFAMLIALLISTWGFVVLVAKNMLTEWYFIGYMAAWAATRAWTVTKIRKENGHENGQAEEGRTDSSAQDARARFRDHARRSSSGPDRGHEDERA